MEGTLIARPIPRSRARPVIQTWKALTASRSGTIGLALLFTIVAMSVIGPLVTPSPYVSDTSSIYQSPTLAHLLGTDFAGRDNLALVIHGGRDILALAVITGVLTTLIAIAVGGIAAYAGGRVDAILTSITDIWLTIPRFILLIVVASLIRIDSIVMLAVLIALFSWPALARQIRAQMLSLRRREFVEAAQLLDLGSMHILLREMLPNMMAFIVISMIGGMTQAIYAQVSLVFLGIVPLANDWAVLFSLAYAKNAIYEASAAWSLITPMGAIILFQLSLVLVLRSLEETFNPRLRGRE